MTRQDVINNVISNYRGCGIDMRWVLKTIKSGEKKGFSYQSIYTGLRMALSEITGRHEYFTVAEVAEAMGATEEEVIQEIEKSRVELEAAGKNPDDYFKKIEPEQIQRFIIPPRGNKIGTGGKFE